MKTGLNLFFTVIFLTAMGWYVTYKTSPSKICQIHPNAKLEDKYLYCWPGFNWPLDTFIDGHSPVEREQYLRKLRAESR